MPVLSLVTARISPERRPEVAVPDRQTVEAEIPIAEAGSSRGPQGQIQASNRAQRSCYPAETTFRAVCEMGLRDHFL